MEMEFLVHPSQEDEWFAYWVAERMRWWTDVMGIASERLRLRPHDADELSHYSRQTTDIEYEFPMGWSELEGIADRTDYDLQAHAAGSGKSLSIFDEASGEHVTPYAIEPAAGVDRAVLTVLIDGYEEQQVEGEKRVVLHLRPSLAPIKVAVMPLLRNRPELALRMLGSMAQHLRVVVGLVDDLMLKDIETRLAHWLLKRCRAPLQDTPQTIQLDRTKRVLAAEMGTTSETLSRTLAKFREQKLLRVTGNIITVTRPAALEKLLRRNLGEI